LKRAAVGKLSPNRVSLSSESEGLWHFLIVHVHIFARIVASVEPTIGIGMESESGEDGARKRAWTQEPDSQSNGADSSPMRQMYARDNRGPAPPKRVACTHCRQSKVSELVPSEALPFVTV
jgi:hypothetical protein